MALCKAVKIAESFTGDWLGVWRDKKARVVGAGLVEYRAYCDSVDDEPFNFWSSPLLPQPGSLYRSSGV